MDWGGLLARGAPTPADAPRPGEDPCALRQPLPAGNETKCDFEILRPGAPPLVVTLDQTWESVTPQALVQRLRVRAASDGPTLWTVEGRTGLTQAPNRILRLGVIPATPGDEHLVYVTGVCAGVSCGTNDAVVVGWRGGALAELLRVRLAAQADIEVRAGGLTTYEGAGPAPQGRTSPRVARSYAWASDRYVPTATAEVPTPTPARP